MGGGRRGIVRAGALGFTAGAAFFAPLLSWIVPASGTVGWVLLSLVMSGWYAVFAVLTRPFVSSRWVALAAPVLWTGVEGLRGRFPLGGLAWAESAYALVDASWLLPLARVVGASGLTFTAALVGVTLYVAGREALRGVSGVARPARPARAGAVALTASAVVAGVLLAPLAAPPPPAPDGRSLDILAVQGNDLLGYRGPADEEDRLIAQRLVATTRSAVAQGGVPDLTIWPEHSFDRDPFTAKGADLRPYVTAAGELTGGRLVAGAKLDGPDPERTYYNTVISVEEDGDVRDTYVKRRYVPFGEYVPARDVLGWFPALANVPRDGVTRNGPQVLDAGGVDIAVALCFESLFSRIVATNVLAGDAGLVVVVTNDAAYGLSPEADQHIAQSRLRAVETGRWTVHAGLAGKSALIDPDGRVVEEAGLFALETIRADVPLTSGTTPYLRLGDVVGVASIALTAVLAAVAPASRWWRRNREAAGRRGMLASRTFPW